MATLIFIKITKAWTFTFSNANAGVIPQVFICAKHHKFLSLTAVAKNCGKARKASPRDK